MSESDADFGDVFWTKKIERPQASFNGIDFLKRQGEFLTSLTDGVVVGSVKIWHLEKQHIKEPKQEARQHYIAAAVQALSSLQAPKEPLGPLDEQVEIVNRALGDSRDPHPIIHVALEISSPRLPGYSHSLINMEYLKTCFLVVTRSSTLGFYEVSKTREEFKQAMHQLFASEKMALVINAVAQRALQESPSPRALSEEKGEDAQASEITPDEENDTEVLEED